VSAIVDCNVTNLCLEMNHDCPVRFHKGEKETYWRRSCQAAVLVTSDFVFAVVRRLKKV
jgi:hypothetical protein